jgi:DnaJ-class molecular chaperone
MNHTEICPVCKGSGKVRMFDGYLVAEDAAHVKGEEEKTCHGCNGKGWVTVENYFCPRPMPPHEWIIYQGPASPSQWMGAAYGR